MPTVFYITKCAFSNILKISPPKTESFLIKILIFSIFLLKNIDCGYGRFPISSNTRIIRTPLTVLKSPPENCSFSPNSHVFLSNSFSNSSNTWSTIHRLYMYSSSMNITYLEFPCAIRWKKKKIHMNCYTKKKKKAVTNKSTSPLMWLIKIVTEALGSTHSRRQLKMNVICKADSKEPKNKSEFGFF